MATSQHDPMAFAKTPRQRAFVKFLRAIETMLEDELDEAIAEVPAEIRERLSEGPKRARYACAVCDAFGGEDFYGGTPDATDPMWRAWGYHEIPKLRMRTSGDLHHGEHANDNYRRALRTYRAAGWTGKAGEPNA